MMMDSRIPLMGQTPDIMGQFQRGQIAAQQGREFGHTNALRDVFQQHGAGIMAGDQNALAQLARFDPAAALGVQDTRAQMGQREQAMRLAFENAQRQGQAFAAEMGAAERAALQAQMQQGLAAWTGSDQSPESWDRIMTQFGATDLVGQHGRADEIIAGVMGLEAALARNAPPEPTTAFQTLDQRARAAGLEPGTPEYAAFMQTGGGQTEGPAAEQRIARLMEDGLPRATAVGIVDGRLRIDRDPMTGEAQVIDIATGRIMFGGPDGVGRGERPAPPTPAGTPPAPGDGATGRTTMPDVDYTAGMGVRGFGSAIANTTAEILNLGLVDPENEAATQALRNLGTRTQLDLAIQVPGRPSNYLMQMFEALTVSPNSPWQGSGRSGERLMQTRDLIQIGIDDLQDVVENRFDYPRTEVAAARRNLNRLQQLHRDYSVVIDSLAPPDRGRGRTTDRGTTSQGEGGAPEGVTQSQWESLSDLDRENWQYYEPDIREILLRAQGQ